MTPDKDMACTKEMTSIGGMPTMTLLGMSSQKDEVRKNKEMSNHQCKQSPMLQTKEINSITKKMERENGNLKLPKSCIKGEQGRP